MSPHIVISSPPDNFYNNYLSYTDDVDANKQLSMSAAELSDVYNSPHYIFNSGKI